MKVQTQFLVIDILKELFKRYEDDLKSEPVSKYRFLVSQDLAETLVILKHGDVPELENENAHNLLKVLLNEYHLIRGIVSLWESGLEAFPKGIIPPSEHIIALQDILGNETHYLHSKPRKKWDKYDISNAMNLLRKSRLAKTVYVAVLSASMLQIDDPRIKMDLEEFSKAVFDTKEELHRASEDIATTHLIAVQYTLEERTVFLPLF